MQVGIFNCLFIFVIAALNDYVIVASIIVIAIRNSINCAALVQIMLNTIYTCSYLHLSVQIVATSSPDKNVYILCPLTQ